MWSETDVQKWIEDLGMNRISKYFAKINGKSLMELNVNNEESLCQNLGVNLYNDMSNKQNDSDEEKTKEIEEGSIKSSELKVLLSNIRYIQQIKQRPQRTHNQNAVIDPSAAANLFSNQEQLQQLLQNFTQQHQQQSQQTTTKSNRQQAGLFQKICVFLWFLSL